MIGARSTEVARTIGWSLAALVTLLLLIAPPPAAAATPAPPSARLHIVLALRADDAGLARFARAVSTPGSPSYGHYLPPAALADRFGAPLLARWAVAAYLRRAGAHRVTTKGMFVTAEVTAAQAERMFSTRLLRYRLDRLRTYIAPAAHTANAGPTSPSALRGLITGVVGLNTRPVVRAPIARPHQTARPTHQAHLASGQSASGYAPSTGTPSGCAEGVGTGGFTPAQYLTAYGFNQLHDRGLLGQGQRIAVIEIDGYRHSDLTTFARCFGLRLPPVTLYTPGGRAALRPGGESTLDLEVLDAAAPGLQELQVYQSDATTEGLVTAFLGPLEAAPIRPQVVSVSLGLCEPQLLEDGSQAAVGMIERALAESAAAGISVLASAGDEGSSGCQNGNTIVDRAAVDYPASSPFVTAVGGTNIKLNPDNSLAGQIVWNDTNVQPGGGGGGESSLFAAPAWQRGLRVAREAGAAPAPLTKRALPDVSMLADVAPGYSIYCTAAADGCAGWQTVGGTSAASPLLAAGLALVDQDLRRHSRELLGEVNPLIYAAAADPAQRAGLLGDVTRFNNDVGPYIGPGSTSVHCCAAGPGFDEASGWGSLDVAAFDALAQTKLPVVADVFLSIPGGQHPLSHRGITARLGCSRSCLAGVIGYVIIGRSDFRISSAVQSFRGRAGRNVRLPFTAAQVARIRRALNDHQRVNGVLYGYDRDNRGRRATLTPGVGFAIGG